jgi:hypothetical protein
MQIFRSRFGQVITWVALGIMVLALWASVEEAGSWGFAQSLAPVGLCLLFTWAGFYNPKIEVGEGKVRLVNVFRTIEIPIGAISRIDTRWALTLYCGEKRYTAWGATAPGRHTSFFATKDQGSHLPESTYLAGTVRPGDLIGSESGAPAAYIRRLWENLRDVSGNFPSVSEPVVITWHRSTLVALLLLTGLSVVVL